ncbi:hypothetical protein [Arenibaculum sp.]|jgi:hypothetical protein|uniref:hypothetical protein n=1 Tax=Arenibaculum sp. TaxID=2865862 RepID=UPI002E110023|nr:hypothetical protein [Arenibaculum sp.]
MPRKSEKSRIEARIRALTLRLLDLRPAADRERFRTERSDLQDRLDELAACG